MDKRYSPNIFQLRIGNVEAIAHRNQVRISTDEMAWQIPNVLITRNGPDETKNEVHQVNDYKVREVCEGDTDEHPKRSARNRKRKRTVTESEIQEQ